MNPILDPSSRELRAAEAQTMSQRNKYTIMQIFNGNDKMVDCNMKGSPNGTILIVPGIPGRQTELRAQHDARHASSEEQLTKSRTALLPSKQSLSCPKQQTVELAIEFGSLDGLPCEGNHASWWSFGASGWILSERRMESFA